MDYLITNNGKGNLKWFEVLQKFNVEITPANLKRISDWWRYFLKTNKATPEQLIDNKSRILIYDIETTYLTARVWNTGKQYVRHDQIKDETQIITVAYTWLNSGEIKYLTWNNNTKEDSSLIKEFAKVYNQADAVCGINSNKFDCKILHARCAKHKIDINTLVPKIDLQVQARRVLRLPSYSMKYLAEYFGVTNKGGHEGITMWIKIQELTGKISEEALKNMVDYNVNDIVTTEELYNRLLPYFSHKIHKGVLEGRNNFTCPDTGSTNVSLYKEITTSLSKQYILKSNETGRKYKVSRSTYKKMY